MKKNFYFIKKPKWGLIALFMSFCCLFGNTAFGQVSPGSSTTNDILVWTGTVSSDWNNVDNWYRQSSATTGIAGISEYPGQDQLDDWAIIPSNGANPPIIKNGEVIRVGRLYVTNQFNGAGGTLTIDSGGRLNVYNISTSQTNCVFLQGGSIVNNGSLFIDSVGIGFASFPSYGIQCATPSSLPTNPTEWGYSGSGSLSINLSGANFAGAGAIVVTGINSTNTTYRMVLNNPTITLNQVTNLGISAIRANGGTNANKLIIAGTGLTLGTAGAPVKASLLNAGNQANVVVESGTTLTLHSAATNVNSAITASNSSDNIPTVFLNKGTINVLGSSTRSGISFSTFGGTQADATKTPPVVMVPSPSATIVNLTNEGTINIDMNISSNGYTASTLFLGNGGGGNANAAASGNIINTSTGVLTLKNTSTLAATGFAIGSSNDGQVPKGSITNNGILNIDAPVYCNGSKFTVVNNKDINSNSEFRGFSAFNNNAGGSINFVKNATTATNKLVQFNGVSSTAGGTLGTGSASAGAVYFDGTNSYTVVIPKYGNSFLTTNIALGASTASISTTSGSLTKTSGTGDATLFYTAIAAVIDPPAAAVASFSASSERGAVSTNTPNSGTISTATGSGFLNSLSSVAASSATSVFSPGGSGKGVAEFNKFSWYYIYGTAKIDVSGNTTAGVDYDQLNNSVDFGGLDITNTTLDVTGIYTPSATLATPINIMSTGVSAPLVGTFATVTGLTPGWSVVYSAPVGETIDPLTSLAYVPARRDGGKVQLAYVQTPIITQLSSNGTDTITQGCEGSTLVILGTKFTGATAVTVNGVPLTGVTVVSDTRIDAVLPIGANSGLVAVTGPEAVGSSAGNFSVIAYSTNTTAVSSFLTYTWANNGQTYTTSGIKTGTTSINCVTELLNLTITTTQIPDSFAPFCKGATIATAKGATGMVFYTAATGGVPLAGTALLANAKTLWVSEIIASVENPTRVSRLITVTTLPATPGTITTTDAVLCKYIGTANTVTYTLPVPAVAVASYNWTATPGINIIADASATDNSITVNFLGASLLNTATGGVGTISARAITSVETGSCASLPKPLVLSSKLPTAPTSLVMTSLDSTPTFNGAAIVPATIPPTFNIVGLNSLSKITKVGPDMGTNTVFILTAPEATTAASYKWTLPTGVNAIASATVVNAGSGIATSTTPVITVDFAGVPAGIGTLPIIVQSVGGCGLSSNRLLSLARVVPTAPKALTLTCTNTTPRFSYKDPLTGITSLDGLDVLSKITKVGPYQSTTIGFYLTATPFMTQGGTATSYAWILPAGVICTSPKTDTTVTVTVPPTVIGGTPTISTLNAIKTTTNTINILFNTTGTGNLDLLVFGVNGAGNSVARKLVVLRSLPTAPTKLVLTDDVISTTVPVTKVGRYIGNTTPLTLTGTPFTVQGGEGRTFIWTLPDGVNVTAGATEEVDAIVGTRTWKSSFTTTSSGTILTVNLAGVAPGVLSLPLNVQSQNLAGTSATTRTLKLTAVLPTAPTALVLRDGPTVVTTAGAYTDKTTPLTLTATPITTQGDTTFSWVLPAGVNVTGGATNATTPITDSNGNRTWTSTGTVLNIDLDGIGLGVLSIPMTVYAVNGVGPSIPRLLTVKAAAPATPGAITTSSLAVPKFNPICATSTTITVQVPAVAGATYAWTVAGGTERIVSGNSTNSIVINVAGVTTTTLSVSVVASNGTGSSSPKTLPIGKTTVCSAKIAPETANTPFDVTAYPNPSSSEFTIETSAKGGINAKVYDMQGRLVEKANSNKVGSRLAAGTYNVIVNQGANTKTLRVVKK